MEQSARDIVPAPGDESPSLGPPEEVPQPPGPNTIPDPAPWIDSSVIEDAVKFAAKTYLKAKAITELIIGLAIAGGASMMLEGDNMPKGGTDDDDDDDDDDENIVYRVLRPGENPFFGLYPQNINANYTVEGHVGNNSKKGYASQYISTTKSEEKALEWSGKSGNPRVIIDLNLVHSRIIDLTHPIVRRALLKHPRNRAFARDSQEVLIERGPVPPIAIRPYFR
ncbi:MAG: hypothetical protein H6581_14695 [Bacteroidia bacterium]|nr:hypothetical protein [Bacteroidia bacterium]